MAVKSWFQSTLNCFPVTSIQFSHDYILAGAGGQLSVYEVLNTSILITKVDVFDSSVIHGIIQNSKKSKLCVFGGRDVAVLTIDVNSGNYRLASERKWRLTDWVLSCQWAGIDDQIVTLSSHNTLTLWDCVTGEKLNQVSCAQKCILYSATILCDYGWYDTVVLAGTVFQQISVWAVTSDCTQVCPVIHHLKGHKGVIFSVSYDKKSRLISSTSDDRTVRIWSVCSSKLSHLTAEDWSNACVTLVLTIFGHTARVWQSYILANKKILSIGEDSQLCLWQADGECISQQEAHQGAGMWCMDVSESQSLVVTGGADGGVSLWPLNTNYPGTRCLPLPGDIPRRVALLEPLQPLVCTESGTLKYYSDDCWSSVFTDDRISSYCLLEASPSKHRIAMATIHADVIVLKRDGFEPVVDQDIGGKKVLSLHWLDEDTLLCCQAEGNLTAWRISNYTLEPVGKVYLPASKERWTTTAVIIESTVVYGDRGGNIHSSPISHSLEDAMEVVQTVHKAHSKQGVCTLRVLDGHVWSSGRDGTIKRFAVSNHSLTLVTSIKLPVEWLVYISHTRLFGLVVIAFHETKVELWTVREMRRLASFPCGGGHRSWSCSIEEDQFCFTYLKNKTAHVLQCSLLHIARPVVKEGFHTKEINTMAHVLEGWVASGGEDGSVRLSHLSGDCWTTPVVQNIHVSSVRTVHVCSFRQQTLLFSAGSRAQMKIWKINLNPLTMTELNSVMLRNEKQGRHWLYTVPAKDPDTRYMDLHTIEKTDSILCVLVACSDAYLRIFHYNVDKNDIQLNNCLKSSQHCLLRVSSFMCENRVPVIVTGGTDGRVIFWDSRQNPPVVVASECLHQSGVNGLCVVANEGSVMIASGGDDGLLALTYFKITTSSSPIIVQKISSWNCSSLHSSVITGVEIVGDWLLSCGGDQRLSLLTWKLTNNTLSAEILSQKCCSVSDIKGLSILQNDRNKLVVCVYGVGFEVLELIHNQR